MGITLNYNRPKVATINSTGLAFSVKASEPPNAPASFDSAGSTGQVDSRILANADDTGGSDIIEVFRVKITPGLSTDQNGVMSIGITVTPVLGDGTIGTQLLTAFNFSHPQNCDSWQSAAGRARQP